MGHGGSRIGAGKKKGSLNKRTLALRELRDNALNSGITPLEVLLDNMRFYHSKIAVAEQMLADAIERHEPTDKILDALRALCNFRTESGKFASDAAPYCHPRLAAVTVAGDKDNPLEVQHVLKDMTPQQAAETYVNTVKSENNVVPIRGSMAP